MSLHTTTLTFYIILNNKLALSNNWQTYLSSLNLEIWSNAVTGYSINQSINQSIGAQNKAEMPPRIKKGFQEWLFYQKKLLSISANDRSILTLCSRNMPSKAVAFYEKCSEFENSSAILVHSVFEFSDKWSLTHSLFSVPSWPFVERFSVCSMAGNSIIVLERELNIHHWKFCVTQS